LTEAKAISSADELPCIAASFLRTPLGGTEISQIRRRLAPCGREENTFLDDGLAVLRERNASLEGFASGPLRAAANTSASVIGRIDLGSNFALVVLRKVVVLFIF